MSAHTPGPWVVEEWASDYGPTGDFSVYQVGAKNKYPIASIQEPFNGKKTKANANLIAAAPDLLEALWVATEHNALHFGEQHNTVIQGRAAIAKATGGAA